MIWLRLLPYAGWPLAALCFGLWLSARDAVIEERGICNEATVRAALDAERIAHSSMRENYLKLLDEQAEQKEREQEALTQARANELAAKAEVAEQDKQIEKLMLEASIDDIPDSGECLNVFVLNDSVTGMRLRAASWDALSPGGWSHGGPNCFRAAGIGGTDSAGRDFATITYGDALKLWGMDRATIKTLNGRLEQIEALGEQ